MTFSVSHALVSFSTMQALHLSAAICDVLYFQAHKLAERIHDIDLESLDGKTVSEVRHYINLLGVTRPIYTCKYLFRPIWFEVRKNFDTTYMYNPRL